MDENKSQPNNKNNLKTVRTYLSDMADTVRENEISVIKVALAEQNKHEREDLYRQIEGSSTKKVFWFLGGLILIGISVYGIFFIREKKLVENIPQVVAREESIISFDEIYKMEIVSTDSLTNKIRSHISEVNTNNNLNGIQYISILENVNDVKEKLSTVNLFSNLEFTVPASLVRSLSDIYMFGLYKKAGTSDKSSLFIIIKTLDYEYTYAGMLEWESDLAGNLFDIFDLDTKENKLSLNQRKWKDVVINNKDVRVLFNEENKPILFYTFANKDNLIITNNENAIKEIISRFIIKNIKPL